MITQKTVWVCSDHSEFDTKKEAVEHEKEWQRKQELYDATFDGQYQRMLQRNGLLNEH